jgi:hypothetical protein
MECERKIQHWNELENGIEFGIIMITKLSLLVV